MNKNYNILVTGATGNIGLEVLQYLYSLVPRKNIIAGVRDIAKAKKTLSLFPEIEYRVFDFENITTFENALDDIDIVFLLRPPAISDIDKYFKPLIDTIAKEKMSKIVFLSVQGVEKSSLIPHYKIEKLIEKSGLGYVFLRPSYFMQNLTTTLYSDIKNSSKIVLPAGKAKFNWMDVSNIGEVAAIVLNNFKKHQNQKIELTGNQNLDFYQVVEIINNIAGSKIIFQNLDPIRFFIFKLRKNEKLGWFW
jgi:uncharacterized protein YbjT (DUF2867 family)